MKNFIAFFFILCLFSCENSQMISEDIEKLRKERSDIINDISKLESIERIKRNTLTSLNEELKVLNILKSGKTPVYIVEFKLNQSRFSLDITEHIKDSMNEITFEIPVDEQFYNSVSKGTKIVDEFRSGSLLLSGSLSSWNMVVINKNIK